MSELESFRIKEAEEGCPFWEAEYEVYSKIEVDKVIAEKDKEIAELKEKMDSIKVKFRKFNDNVCRKIVDASRIMSAISQDALMDFYEEFIAEAK